MNLKITECSDEELVKRDRAMKVLTSVLVAVMILLIVTLIILMKSKGFNVLSVIPLVLLPIMVVNFKSLKEIRTELKRRKLVE